MLALTAALAVKHLKGLIALARKRPGDLSNSSAGTGTIGYLVGEYFKMMTGTRILHVPYKGGAQAEAAVMAGHVQMLFDPMTGVGAHIQSGRLRALGAVPVAGAPEQFAELGIIPAAAAVEIRGKAKLSALDPVALAADIARTCAPILSIAHALAHACDGDAGDFVHWGAPPRT